MEGKATLLMIELASEIGFDDVSFAGDLHGGVATIGQIPHCGEYPSENVLPLMRVEGLRGVSQWCQHAAYAQSRRHSRSHERTHDRFF